VAVSPVSPIDLDSARAGATACSSARVCVADHRPLQTILKRILLLALLFVAELIALSIWLDGASLANRAGLLRFMHDWGALLLRAIVGFAAIFVTFAFLRYKQALANVFVQIARHSINKKLLVAHGVAMAAFVALSFLLYSGATSSHTSLVAIAWWVAGICGMGFAALAFLSLRAWTLLLRTTGLLWAYALMSACAACTMGNLDRWFWGVAQYVRSVTFTLTKIFLSLFMSGIVTDAQTMIIGTHRFRVQIAPECSGLEGVALIVTFGVLWLSLFRKECRFPQALLLIPLGAALAFVLNAARIAALIVIGNAGAPQIALGGFHSQAGWIAFSAVAVGFCFIVQRVPWFTSVPREQESSIALRENATPAFLLPFLMILAAGMIATATAGSFPWLYPLCFFAAAGALWVFRKHYANMSWKFNWMAPIIGAVVFLLWIAIDHFLHVGAERGVPTALMASSKTEAAAWITFRVLAAVVTVPLAEELAFRGFLLRRMMAADFELVSFRRLTWVALLGSSVIFGVMHGGYWLAGSMSGVLFALAVSRRGSMGEAVVAHATANALLAGYVLLYHQWHLW
jgi:exosortase E/protease (VPEID-CTERM system)